MHHSLKIKILDLDHIESIVEQDITDVEAEKIVGGGLSKSKNKVANETIIKKPIANETIIKKPIASGTLADSIADGTGYAADPLADFPLCAWLLVEPINLLNQADCW